MRQSSDVVRRLLAPFLLLLALALPAAAHADTAAVQTAWRLLDYIAVDYRGAVADGRVTSPSEYAEMREFSASVTRRLGDVMRFEKTKARWQGKSGPPFSVSRFLGRLRYPAI